MQRSENHLLQAVCDRVVLDSANVAHVATAMSAEAGSRRVPGGRTVLQVLRHIAFTNERNAAELKRIRLGQAPASATAGEQEADDDRHTATLSLEPALAALHSSRRAFLEQLHLLSAKVLAAPIDGVELLPLVTGWSMHYVRHGMDLIEAVTEVRQDPIVLSWLLHAEFPNELDLVSRQRRLYEEAKALASARQEIEAEPDPEEE